MTSRRTHSSNGICLNEKGRIVFTKKLFKRKFSKFSPNSKHYKAGHYTQMVWKNTRQFGMGVSKINNKVYVVARYFPAGNWIGKHIY